MAVPTGVSGALEPLAAELSARLGPDRIRAGAPLGPLTSFGIGGPAELLVETRDAPELERTLRLAFAAGVNVTLLGGGSNLLVADGGVRGLVVRARGGRIQAVGPERLRADAGVSVNGLVRHTVQHGLGGLAAWAGTPGTVGGGIHGNAHFEGRLLGEQVERVKLLGRDGRIAEHEADEMEFGYDWSRLRRTSELLLWAEFRVAPADPALLRERARRSLAHRKRTQPLALPSAGCVFQNPDPTDPALPPGLPASAGALVDAAGLKGAREGGATISPVHANFIVNTGGARALEVAALIERARRAVAERFGVMLKEELVRLGAF